MKCLQCVREGKKSIVTKGATYANAGPYYPIQYDEDGRLMPTPSPTSYTSYSCSNGHVWMDQK